MWGIYNKLGIKRFIKEKCVERVIRLKGGICEMAKAKKNVLGAWAFLVGVILAVVVGLLGLAGDEWTIALVILGIIIGLLNIGGEELKDFMLAGTVLVVVSALGGTAVLGPAILGLNLGAILNALITLFVPATIVVALKAVFVSAKR